jgi:hypothetical protein
VASVSLVAGIDYSTHAIDVVLIDEDTLKPEWGRLELSGSDAFDRTRSLCGGRGTCPEWKHTWDDVLAVGIEEPRGHNPGPLFRIQGAVLMRIPSATLVQPWIPSEWRKAVGLKGNASKQDVNEWAFAQTSHEWYEPTASWPQDACDAYCIARATLGAIERSTTDA